MSAFRKITDAERFRIKISGVGSIMESQFLVMKGSGPFLYAAVLDEYMMYFTNNDKESWSHSYTFLPKQKVLETVFDTEKHIYQIPSGVYMFPYDNRLLMERFVIMIEDEKKHSN